ncbi:MAG TPA: DUF433 domain-containing protein [Solirubrobacteraceae bacterium]|nr:DUF433 domain-containing protein [Solirubrobacteraceae bacterium]
MSFRFDTSVIEHLKRRADEVRAPQTELAERYIEEGLRRDQHPLIYFRDGAAGRRPALYGTRLDVADVISTIRQNNSSVEQAAEYLEMPVEQAEAALRYYADFKEDVDDWTAQTEAVADRERARWERQQEALA